MKEKDIAADIKNGGTGGGFTEHGMTVVKLEGRIKGKMASILRQMLELDEHSREYAELAEQLRAKELEYGFVYDLSPAYVKTHINPD